MSLQVNHSRTNRSGSSTVPCGTPVVFFYLKFFFLQNEEEIDRLRHSANYSKAYQIVVDIGKFIDDNDDICEYSSTKSFSWNSLMVFVCSLSQRDGFFDGGH